MDFNCRTIVSERMALLIWTRRGTWSKTNPITHYTLKLKYFMALITTEQKDGFPKIEWETNELIDRDTDERMEVYSLHGVDDSGNQYSGIATYFIDQLDSIKDIEKITSNTNN